jgi:hypothetical protein
VFNRILTRSEQTALSDAKRDLQEQATRIYMDETEHYLYVQLAATIEEIGGMLNNQYGNIQTRDADIRVDAALKRSEALLERAQVVDVSGDFHTIDFATAPRSGMWIETAF